MQTIINSFCESLEKLQELKAKIKDLTTQLETWEKESYLAEQGILKALDKADYSSVATKWKGESYVLTRNRSSIMCTRLLYSEYFSAPKPLPPGLDTPHDEEDDLPF